MQVNSAENSVTTTIEQEKNVQENIETQTQNQSQETQEDVGEKNWKAFREQRKKERAEKEAIERKAAEKEAELVAIKKAMEALVESRQPSQNSYQNEYQYPQEETQEQMIKKQVDAAIAAREAQYRREEAEREAREYPNRLTQTYSDFSQVVSDENLDWLDHHYPEISRPLQRLPNDYQKWSDIYHTVKKLVPNHSTAKRDSAKAEANFNKPKSMSSVGASQSPQQQGAPRLSEERMRQNWERMQKTLKGLS